MLPSLFLMPVLKTYTSKHDPYLKVSILSHTSNPQTLVWQAMHTCYSENLVAFEKVPTEADSGERIIRHLLAGNRGHWGPLEHSAISFNIGYAPHSMWQQLRTHRVGVTFDIQSMRYTSKRFLEYASEWAVYDIDRLQSLVYLRPVGYYTDRQGAKYYYSPNDRDLDLRWAHQSVLRYADKVKQGVSEEHARGLLPFDYRQHGVMSCNLRSLMHLLDLRAKLDAQIEIQWTMDLLMEAFRDWCPEVAAWYEKNRLGKARLAP